jgi:hypothetical protein
LSKSCQQSHTAKNLKKVVQSETKSQVKDGKGNIQINTKDYRLLKGTLKAMSFGVHSTCKGKT